jgi:aminoglycoside 3-N-acetyltransferase
VTERPLATRSTLAADLTALGLGWGDVVCVHSSMRALGRVLGGPVAVVQALVDVVGRHGTVVVPTHTPDNSEPSRWQAPPAPEAEWPTIRAEMPGFHPRSTPSRHMGVIAELVRTWPAARRSEHPQLSFAAIGDRAEELTHKQRLAPGFGADSPLGRLVAARGKVLLLGVGFDACSVFHVGEQRAGAAAMVEHGSAVATEGDRRWVTWADLDHDAAGFAELGAAFAATGVVSAAPVAAATAQLFPAPAAADFATDWLARERA